MTCWKWRAVDVIVLAAAETACVWRTANHARAASHSSWGTVLTLFRLNLLKLPSPCLIHHSAVRQSPRHSRTLSCSSPELLSSPCPSVPNTSVPAETSPRWDAPDNLFELPSFSPAVEPTFTWGSYDSAAFIHSLNAIYDEVVHWKLNLFKVPYLWHIRPGARVTYV